MITIRKIRSLKEGTRFRKYISILSDLEEELKNNYNINFAYWKLILDEISTEKNLNSRCRELSRLNIDRRNVNNLRHSIMKTLSIEPSEWDFIAPKDNKNNSTKYPINLYLDDIRSPFNLGSLFRTAECFGISNIVLSKDTTSPKHNRAKRTSMGCIDLIDWRVDELNNIKRPIFALELGGTPIDQFEFPKEGTVIIGSEELGVSPEALKIADSSLGRVSIPLSGSKSSLNVANATAILLQRWHETLKG